MKLNHSVYSIYKTVKATTVFAVVLVGIFTVPSNKNAKDVGSTTSLFDGVYRVYADTPSSASGSSMCDASAGCGGEVGICANCVGGCSYCDGSSQGSSASSGNSVGGEVGICANCVGGCSYSDGSSQGSSASSGASDCGASASSPGATCAECGSSGTGCGLY